MGSIFWGMIFVLFDFSIEANGIKLGFLPDFVGYLFLLNGLNGKNGLGAENKWFLKAVPFARGMAVYTGILYVLDLFGLSYRLSGVSMAMWTAAVAVCFLILYCIIQGIKNMEKQYGIQLNGDNLINVWKLDLLCQRFLSGQAAV